MGGFPSGNEVYGCHGDKKNRKLTYTKEERLIQNVEVSYNYSFIHVEVPCLKYLYMFIYVYHISLQKLHDN